MASIYQNRPDDSAAMARVKIMESWRGLDCLFVTIGTDSDGCMLVATNNLGWRVWVGETGIDGETI